MWKFWNFKIYNVVRLKKDNPLYLPWNKNSYLGSNFLIAWHPFSWFAKCSRHVKLGSCHEKISVLLTIFSMDDQGSTRYYFYSWIMFSTCWFNSDFSWLSLNQLVSVTFLPGPKRVLFLSERKHHPSCLNESSHILLKSNMSHCRRLVSEGKQPHQHKTIAFPAIVIWHVYYTTAPQFLLLQIWNSSATIFFMFWGKQTIKSFAI